MTASPRTACEVQEANKATAARFIHGFNDDDWETVRDVVAPGFVFHHPLGGTVEAGPDGMVSTWAGFKVLSPDSWHPIPVMIADGDFVAVLLPTYGHFSGQGEHAPPPTGGRLDYGMVNMVRLEGGKLAEMWFGMDPLVEMQQLGVAPPPVPRELTPTAEANLAAFRRTVSDDAQFDNVAPFEDVVVAISPPQSQRATSTRRVEIYQFDGGEPTRVYAHEIITNPTYEGDSTAKDDVSRGLVERWITEIQCDHDAGSISSIASQHLVIHPTAMPGEATYHGTDGAAAWLNEQWTAFPDLAITDHFTVADRDIVAVRWTARGTSRGEYMGVPATTGPVEFSGVSMYRVEDGTIAEIWDTRNTLGILHQLNPDIGGGHRHHH